MHIEYNATTDKATPVNLTSHCYFNLSGNKEENIFNHDLQINAPFFLETNDALIPTGKSGATKNTKKDFTTPQNLGELINQNQEYDNCWVLNKQEDDIVKAATLLHKKSGRMVTVCTTSPGLQFYSGNFLDGTLKNTKNAKQYNKYAGLCLEAQHFPDSPNNKHFSNTILEPGNVYHQKTIYSFHQST
ncbi:MAG: hypothetical protein IPP48_05330 [Chitinophagaceae bacterium]|nr:hypothetical protein [Chitinophagaceae bacterium]